MDIVLAFDMDDTLTDTNGYIIQKLRSYYKESKNEGKLELLEDLVSKGIGTLNFPNNLNKDTSSVVIGPGQFMLEAEPTELFNNLEVIQAKLLAKGVNPIFIICTHRGFHLYGEIYTANWLNSNGKLDMFEDIRAITGKEQPNKIDFLKAEYPGYEIMLIDDNPFHAHDGDDYERCEDVLIYDKINKYPAYKHQTTYESPDQLVKHICNKLNIVDVVEELGAFGEA